MPIGSPPAIARHRHAGFTYLGVLFLVALMALGLSGVLQTWSLSKMRERERELLWVGNQYARALQSYYQRSPGIRQYPSQLDELLEDNRFPNPQRHLRQLYADPITGGTDWGLIKTPDGRIVGVHSASDDPPWKRSEFSLRWEGFKDKTKYSDWRFVANVGLLGDLRPPVGSPIGSPTAAPTGTPTQAHR